MQTGNKRSLEKELVYQLGFRGASLNTQQKFLIIRWISQWKCTYESGHWEKSLSFKANFLYTLVLEEETPF
jgi:hypothetical protein